MLAQVLALVLTTGPVNPALRDTWRVTVSGPTLKSFLKDATYARPKPNEKVDLDLSDLPGWKCRVSEARAWVESSGVTRVSRQVECSSDGWKHSVVTTGTYRVRDVNNDRPDKGTSGTLILRSAGPNGEMFASTVTIYPW